MLITSEEREYVYNGKDYYVEAINNRLDYEDTIIVSNGGTISIMFTKNSTYIGCYEPAADICCTPLFFSTVVKLENFPSNIHDYSLELDMESINDIFKKLDKGLAVIEDEINK